MTTKTTYVPTDVQIRASTKHARNFDLKARHVTASGLIINEYRRRGQKFVAFTAKGEIVYDTLI